MSHRQPELPHARQAAIAKRFRTIVIDTAVFFDQFGWRLQWAVRRGEGMVAKNGQLVVRTGADEWLAENLFETLFDPMVNAVAPSAS